MGEVRQAITWCEKAVRLNARRGDRVALAQVYNNLGSIYGELGDSSRAAKFLRESIRIRERAGHSGLATGYANLGEVLLQLGEFDEAARYVERALALCESGPAPAYLRPDAWRMMAEIRLAADEPAPAADAAREAIRWSRGLDDPARLGPALRVLAEALAEVGQGADAQTYLEEAVAVLEPIGHPLELARVLAALGRQLDKSDPVAAAEYTARATALFETVEKDKGRR